MLRTMAFVASVFLVLHIPYSTLAITGTNGPPDKNTIFSHCAYAAGDFFACSSDTTHPADSTQPAKKKTIWQRIASIFAFRARADKRWSERAKKLIDSMGIMDSITAQHDNIRNLTDSQKIYYNSLLVMVGAIEKKLAADTATGKGGAAPPGEPTITTDSSGFSPMTDAIQALADKLSPIMDQQKAAAAEALKKSAALAILSRADYPGTVFNSKGDTVTQYRYFLKGRTGIYGFHNYTYNGKYKSYSFDRITGLIYNGLTIDTKGFIYSNGWDTARAIRDARDAGTGVYANFLLQTPYRIKAFLQDTSSRNRFIRHLAFLLAPDTAAGFSHIQAANKARGKIMGINIAFDGLPLENKEDFVDFIKQIRSSKGFADSTYQLFVTLPIVDTRQVFDLAGLDPLVDKFIVNFVADHLHPPIGNGPVFPLNGGQPNSILTCVSQLSNEGILPGKMIIGIPYFGARWLVSKTSGAGRFIQYLNYSDIRTKTGWTSATDAATGAVYMDSTAGRGFRDSVYRIWFDDESTLGAKYDYIVSSQLGGIAISTLGYDAGYGELWDELSYKLLQLDSVPMSYTIASNPVIPETGWLGKITDRMYLYWYILQHPCELCFDNIQDSTTSQKVWLYMNELRLDSIINKKNKNLCDTCRFNSRFQYINNEMANFTGWSTIILLALTIIALLIYLYGIRTFGSQWPHRNLLLIFVRSFFIVWVLFLFTWAFCDKRAGIFNAHRDRNMAATRALGITVTFTRETPVEASNSKWFASDEAYCDDALLRGKCIDMPLSIFLSILLAGMLAGYLINKFTTTVTENDQVP